MAVSAPLRRRVVVTGLGCVSPLGVGVEATWRAAIEGRSGVRAIDGFDTSAFPVRIAGQVDGEIPFGDLPDKEARRFDRVILLALGASLEAWQGSGLDGAVDPTRAGVAIGSGIGGLGTLESSHLALVEKGPRRVSPFTIPMIIGNMPAGVVAIRLGLRGPNLCQVSACSTGSHNIGEAARLIERGDADVMLAGGSEAANTPLALAAFASMRALSTRNDAPAAASRPFDQSRDGFVIGEGAAVLVLEAEEYARARGAEIHAELLGYGRSADASHITLPEESGEGASRCIQLALADAGLAPTDVQHLNAHATSTPAGDVVEARAVRAVFGSHAASLAVSATKSMTGHLLGAAGALEALFCIRALETGLLPPTINLDRPDPDCELDHVANKARPCETRFALSNSFGFGGTNASLVLGRG
ncbi:MAG: beta-ketoacyl-ACP synthase II [Myxococcota bacterium]|nr:beta-ketoacyl-ACP synthase II [Myxococcota bacterium]